MHMYNVHRLAEIFSLASFERGKDNCLWLQSDALAKNIIFW